MISCYCITRVVLDSALDKPVPANHRIQRACSPRSSISAWFPGPGDVGGPGVSASDLFHLAHSPCGQYPQAPTWRYRFLRSSPSPVLFGPTSEGKTASISGSSMGHKGDGDEVAQRRSVVSVAHLAEPQASNSTVGASVQRDEDPDVELGALDKG